LEHKEIREVKMTSLIRFFDALLSLEMFFYFLGPVFSS
jgi:hypothetical protein